MISSIHGDRQEWTGGAGFGDGRDSEREIETSRMPGICGRRFWSSTRLGAVMIGIIAGLGPLPAAEVPSTFDGRTPLDWSVRMADSEMKRLGDSLEFGGSNPKAHWDYSAGVLALSMVRLGESLNRDAYIGFGTRAVASYVKSDGEISGYRMNEYSLDNIQPGTVLLAGLARGVKNEAWIKAVRVLREQLATQPRTADGGYWHKNRYPHQMWLDGLYMASPFLAEYASIFHEPALCDEAAKQIILMDRHAFDPSTGLYRHGWDETRTQAWANRTTGLSPNFWSRSIGWYAMAIVDSLDYMPPGQPERRKILEIFNRVAEGVVRWQDIDTGLWWQVTDQGGRKGNYQEASGSAMFVYALAKGVNRGYLPRGRYLRPILRGYEGMIAHLIKTEPDGNLALIHVCQGAGLGFTMANGRPRDGSYDYYVSEPVVDNDPKGTGPFILAGIEVQKLLSGSARTEDARLTGWKRLPAVLDRIKAPKFAARRYLITDFGAKPGGTVDCTAAIRRAVETCHTAGGGQVVVPQGVYLTGPIELLGGVDLDVAAGATLQFRSDPAAYLPTVATRWEGVECWNYAPLIRAANVDNVAVTGPGVLDGSASEENWWAWARKSGGQSPATPDSRALNLMGDHGVPVAERQFGAGHKLRPNFIEFLRCRNVLVSDVTIRRSPMWEIHPVLCSNVTVRGVRISSHGPNNDGCDPESCRDVLIDGCTFDTGDDCIAIKSGRNADGRRVGVPVENIVVRNCAMKDGHAGVAIGSEISGGCKGVFIEDCVMDSPRLDRALRIKSNAVRGGTISGIYMRRCKVGHVSEALLTIDLLYEEGARGDFPPSVTDVTIDDVKATAAQRVLFIKGFPAATIDRIRLSRCEIEGDEQHDVFESAGRIQIDHVTVRPAHDGASLNSRAAP
jgi:unsaturated rhamnogalacturonyl hydrolase